MSYLNHALTQTGYDGVRLTPDNWRDEIVKQIKGVNWDEILADLEPFVKRRGDLKAFRREFLIAALQDRR